MASSASHSPSPSAPRSSSPHISDSPLPFPIDEFDDDDLFLDPDPDDTLTPRSLSVQPAMNTAFIDLTGDSSPPPPARASSHLSSRSSREPARKRRRLDDSLEPRVGTSSAAPFLGASRPATQSEIDFAEFIDIDAEEVDLTRVEDEKDLEEHRKQEQQAKVDEQQRQMLLNESIASQNAVSASTGKLSDLSCIICMESMTDLTVTHCGHLFCHTCIMEALIAGENQSSEPGKGSSRCPVCRKKVARNPKGREIPQVIPLELKLKKVQSEKAKGKQREVIADPPIGD